MINETERGGISGLLTQIVIPGCVSIWITKIKMRVGYHWSLLVYIAWLVEVLRLGFRLLILLPETSVTDRSVQGHLVTNSQTKKKYR